MIIVAASILRVAGGWLADRVGGIRMLVGLAGVIIACTVMAATVPANPWVMVAILVVCFSAMGAGNGAVFQLVPLRFKTTTAVAGSLVGEIGALAGGMLPNAMGLGMQQTGSFGPGFLSGTLLAIGVLGTLLLVMRQWTRTWVGEGGKAREEGARLPRPRTPGHRSGSHPPTRPPRRAQDSVTFRKRFSQSVCAGEMFSNRTPAVCDPSSPSPVHITLAPTMSGGVRSSSIPS